MMTTDGEPAKSRRRPFDPTLRPRSVEANMSDVFARLCEAHLDRLGPEADLVAEYFEPISLLAMAHAMGIEDDVDVTTLRQWFSGFAAGIGNYENDPQKWAACASIAREFERLVAPRLAALMEAPDGSMLSNVIHGGEGSLDERIAWAMPSLKLVLMAGLQEPGHGAATTMFALLHNVEQLKTVREEPRLVEAAVDEGLRWIAPIGNLLRGVLPGSTLAGSRFPDDARVILVAASANRDQTIWGPTADRFDAHRPRRTHMSFATGPHYCIGHHFAKVQLRVAITKLIGRFPRLRLDPSHETSFWGHEYRSAQAIRVLTS